MRGKQKAKAKAKAKEAKSSKKSIGGEKKLEGKTTRSKKARLCNENHKKSNENNFAFPISRKDAVPLSICY